MERLGERARRQRLPSRPHHLPPETKAAIHRASVHKLEQHPVGIAMHDPFDRAERMITDRIVPSSGSDCSSTCIWDELPCNRIVWVIWIDQLGDGRRYGDRVARRDLLQRRHRSGGTNPASASSTGRRRDSFRAIMVGLASIGHGPYA